MPLSVFEENGKFGLKNASGIHLTTAKYEYLEIYDELITARFKQDDVNEVHYLDHAGDLIANLNETLPEKFRGDVIEAYPLDKDLRVFLYFNWEDMELFGVTNSKGILLIEPEYSEFDLLPNGMIKSFHQAPYSEFDGDGNALYGYKIHYRNGDLLSKDVYVDFEINQLKEVMTLYFKNGKEIDVPLKS